MVGFGEGHRPGAAPLGAVSNYFFSVFVRGLISPPYTGFVPPSSGPRRHGSAGRDTALHKSMALLLSFPILRARVKQELSRGRHALCSASARARALSYTILVPGAGIMTSGTRCDTILYSVACREGVLPCPRVKV